MEMRIWEYVLAIVLAVIAGFSVSGCTGPFGVVVGGERVHELYNARFQQRYDNGFNSPMDYHTRDEKRALAAEIAKGERLSEDIRRKY